ncbi:MAG: hypothetical protein IJ070_02790 [Firmicutes bacterium]|nr:hypothetical protein [Bacillota bacterium]
MDYEQFLKQVAEDLKYSIPNATIEMSDVVKVQGESYRGISVRMNDSPIAASMNLRGAHERLMDGADYHDILQSIHDQAIEAISQGRGFDLDLVQDYGKAKERLCMEVIPIKGNRPGACRAKNPGSWQAGSPVCEELCFPWAGLTPPEG